MSDLMKLFKREVEPFEVKAVPLNQIYQCTIDDDFTDVRQFAQLVDYLNNANEGDIAHIKLSTNGGALHAIIPLIEAMRNTDAHIAMHVESDTASAGTILMMLAHEIYINPYTTIMIHTASYGFYGHSGNMDANVSHSTKAIHRLVNEVYAGFLTPNEIARVLDGKEFYLTAEEAMERFNKRDDAIREAIAEQMKPAKKPRKPRNKKLQAVIDGDVDVCGTITV
jgi:ATP-dependent protease ClpP protease subunit